jgi:uncharacterized protein (DUF4415 family)
MEPKCAQLRSFEKTSATRKEERSEEVQLRADDDVLTKFRRFMPAVAPA